jgi:hypothetical protein
MSKCSGQKKYKPSEILEDLTDYELIKDISVLRKLDRIKYIRKSTGEYKKGGLVVSGDKKKGYIVIQSFARNWKTCQPIKFSVKLSDIILFRYKE